MAPRKRGGAGGPAGPVVELANLPVPNVAPAPSYDDGALFMMPPAPSESRAERELDEILQEIGGGDIKVKVSRFADSGAMQACGEMAGDTFSMEALTDTFGGGRYLLRFMRGRSEVDKTRVEVDSLIPPRNPRAPKMAAPAAPGAQSSDFMAMMMPMMTMMMTIMQTSQQGTATLLTGMAEMFKARPAEKDPMDMALRMAEVMKQNPGVTSPVDMFAIFEKGMNVAAKMGGGDGDDVLPLVGEGVKGVVAIMEGIGAEKKANAAALEARNAQARLTAPAIPVASIVPVAPVAIVPPPPALAPSEVIVDARPWVAAALPFREQLGLMMGFLSPATAAAALLEKLSDDQLDDLLSDIEDVTAPGFVSRAFGVLRPGAVLATADAQWLTDVAVAVVQSTESAPDDGDVASGAEGGGA